MSASFNMLVLILVSWNGSDLALEDQPKGNITVSCAGRDLLF